MTFIILHYTFLRFRNRQKHKLIYFFIKLLIQNRTNLYKKDKSKLALFYFVHKMKQAYISHGPIVPTVPFHVRPKNYTTSVILCYSLTAREAQCYDLIWVSPPTIVFRSLLNITEILLKFSSCLIPRSDPQIIDGQHYEKLYIIVLNNWQHNLLKISM